MKFLDGLINVVANLGTGRDKAAHSQYVTSCMPPFELLSAYRASWLAAAIVDYPAEDSTRNWRNWRAEAEQITKIEALEKKLNLKGLVGRAIKDARLYGGAAIYINTGEADQKSPLNTSREIRSLVVLTSMILRPKEIVQDIESDYYGKAEFYTLQTRDSIVDIHASRLVIFTGRQLPADACTAGILNVFSWGDSVLEAAMPTVLQYDSTMANMASLVFEAKVDVFKFEGFAEMLADSANDAAVSRRLQSQAAMKGINGAVVIDMKDDYQQKSANFSGLTEVISKIQESASGAAEGVPVTRLFGRSAAGLSGSGDGDERVYYDRIKQNQETQIGPAMRLLDECLIYQALGNRPSEIYYEWAPLRQTTIGERAEVFSKTASAARALAGATVGELLPLDALSESLANELTELGVLPGLDQAIKKFGTLAEQGLPDDSIPELDPELDSLINQPQNNEEQL